MKHIDDVDSMEDAFADLMKEAFKGRLKPQSVQWYALRKFFFAGGLFMAVKARDGTREEVSKILGELEDFFEGVKQRVELKRDIERSGR